MDAPIVLTRDSTAPAEVLVVSPEHPFPPRCGSSMRLSQSIRYLAERGVCVDLAVLSDRTSPGQDRLAAEAALEHCQRVLVVRHPVVTSPLARLFYRTWGRTVGFRLGDWLHLPARFVRAIRRHLSVRSYQTVIISNVQLARLTDLFRPPTRRILDAHDVWYDRYLSYAAQGRGAELLNFSDPAREARLVSRFDAVLAISSRDAEIFRQMGVKCPITVVPLVGDRELLDAGEGSAGDQEGGGRGDPARPPRILFVGTETSTNLDAIRFFRKLVFPVIRKQVPTCRLRVVGRAAHHLVQGPAVDLVGWVDDLSVEYRDAALVVVPLRMGSGLKTKVVEALAHGKALLTTPVGAQGVKIVPGRHAVVSDDPAVLAREGVRILTDDSLRRVYEDNALELARRCFDPDVALRPFLDLLKIQRDVKKSPVQV